MCVCVYARFCIELQKVATCTSGGVGHTVIVMFDCQSFKEILTGSFKEHCNVHQKNQVLYGKRLKSITSFNYHLDMRSVVSGEKICSTWWSFRIQQNIPVAIIYGVYNWVNWRVLNYMQKLLQLRVQLPTESVSYKWPNVCTERVFKENQNSAPRV